MKPSRKSLLSIVVTIILVVAAGSAAAQWSFNPPVAHRGQPNTWTCGPTNIAMWAGYIRSATLDITQIANAIGASDGTTIPEFLSGMNQFDLTSNIYVEWEYIDKEGAVKGIMRTIAKYSQPVVIAGGTGFFGFGAGSHYLLVRGGTANANPNTNYSESNHITGVLVNDSTQGSPAYTSIASGMRNDTVYAPSVLANYWPTIGASGDKKYRSVERHCATCTQGGTYENNLLFTNF